MGLRINSIDGLVSAQGYELCIMTFGLAGLSPEARIIHQNFNYMADALGPDGMIITGGYDSEFHKDAHSFLTRASQTIYGAAIDTSSMAGDLPIPALIALRRSSNDSPEMGYFHIEGYGEQQIIDLFRQIARASETPGGVDSMPQNVLRKKGGQPARAVWESIQLRPSIGGFGIDLKPFIEGLFRRR